MSRRVLITLSICTLLWIIAYRARFWIMYSVGRLAHRDLHTLVLSLPHTPITRETIPDHMKDKILIVSLRHHPRRPVHIIKDTFAELRRIKHPDFVSERCCVLDYLDTRSPYSFSAHTDTEWNALQNSGFQAWYLLENAHPNNLGNMFFIDNAYLYNKYSLRGIYYSLSKKGDHVVVSMNRPWLATFSKCPYELERLPLRTFMQMSTVYYLDVDVGDCVLFDRGLCHMTDTRFQGRYAINFRILHGHTPMLRKTQCGYIANTSVVYQSA